ncbi:succinate dehydrogenase cytochrome b subunit [Thermomonospora cellulosilytica]|uniref:Succinate dehydrogenase / fumarate reductase cytochrome b subunit n=1 Tax=Thermomonospora cellulosilytica TaxID=1411118 RepID=A0A7W3R8J7_9ACTN|nr:succinate dehydrogenase cytochrome b subunit [Thermomonospora cellulosilytica]MBA9003811.1 succinate dehydrogenase / fumarate reductase cytochrome b subunit [Thermomonospora cellulosilytica]
MVQTSPRAIPALYRSTVGKKTIMAVTGAVLVLYLVAHMVGNLKIFFGPEEINEYAAWLRTIGAPVLHHEWFLWIMRVVLLASVILHITMAVQLTARARRARPVRYRHRARVQGSYAARTMRWGGVIIALFVVYHVLDLTTGTVNPGYVHGDVYRNVAADFAPERWYVTLFYVLAVVAVGFHLRHGLVSAAQSLGVTSPQRARTLNLAATAFAVVLVAGYLSVPFAVTVGLVD